MRYLRAVERNEVVQPRVKSSTLELSLPRGSAAGSGGRSDNRRQQLKQSGVTQRALIIARQTKFTNWIQRGLVQRGEHVVPQLEDSDDDFSAGTAAG